MEDDLNFLVHWKTTSIYRQMEETLNYLSKWKTNALFFFQIEDDLNCFVDGR